MNTLNQKKDTAFFESTTYDKPHSMIWDVNYVPAHFHKHFEILCVMEGSVIMTVDGERRTLAKGDAVYISPNIIHSYERCGECKRFISCFEPECVGTFGELMLKYKPSKPFIDKEVMKQLFPNLFEYLRDIWLGYEKGRKIGDDNLEYVSYLSKHNHFITKLLTVTGIEKFEHDKNNHYNEALRICCERYTEEKFNAEALAKLMNISESSVHKLFAKNMHMNFKSYITDLRMSKAREYLQYTDMNISEIALHIGCGSIRTFNRVFADSTGMSPGEYRKEMRLIAK